MIKEIEEHKRDFEEKMLKCEAEDLREEIVKQTLSDAWKGHIFVPPAHYKIGMKDEDYTMDELKEQLKYAKKLLKDAYESNCFWGMEYDKHWFECWLKDDK